jgi:hypothetical protein
MFSLNLDFKVKILERGIKLKTTAKITSNYKEIIIPYLPLLSINFWLKKLIWQLVFK